MTRAVGAAMAPSASILVEFGIPALALVVVALVGVTIHRTVGRRAALAYALGAAAWLSVTAVLARAGFLARFGGVPPRLTLVLVPALGLPVLLGLSRLGRALAGAPLWLLIGFQGFRLPLELLMHRAAVEGTMPPQMTYTGANFDIASGATALVLGLIAARGSLPRWLVIGWNVLGTTLLVTILAIAIASLPTFAVFGREPERLNTWVAYFPYVWLPAGLVSAAVLGHVLLWRRLLSRDMRGCAPELLS
jgi:hypothetical protein